MQVNEENEEQNQGGAMPSLNDIISSNNEINPNEVVYQSSATNGSYQPAGQAQYSYTTNDLVTNEIKEEDEIPQEITEIKAGYKKDGGENTRYEQTTQVQEEPNSTTKIVKRVIQTEKPTTETSYYEKRIVKTTTTTTTTTTRGGESSTQNINSRYSNANSISTNNNVRNRNVPATTTTTYTRPTPSSSRGGDRNINIVRNYDSGRSPTSSQQNNRYGNTNYQNQSRNVRGSSQTQKIIPAQSYTNKYQPKKPDNSNINYMRKARSPGQNEIKRKTIYRGDPIKNVQITHIICSSKPQDFHITEDLDTEYLQTEPIEISQADRAKLKKTGKTSWTTSVQDNIKPIVTNLKGKTTVFQHARGIGMTNEKRENINPMFYTSEIKKLDPIVKEKEKEKVEYLTFRNNGNRTINTNNTYNGSNTSRSNYNSNRGNNYVQQKKNYSSNTNPSYNYNNENNRSSRINTTTTTRTNQTYTRGNYNNSGKDGEIVKETRTKVQMGSRSQYRNGGNPVSSVTTEKKVYTPNTFFNNK